MKEEEERKTKNAWGERQHRDSLAPHVVKEEEEEEEERRGGSKEQAREKTLKQAHLVNKFNNRRSPARPPGVIGK